MWLCSSKLCELRGVMRETLTLRTEPRSQPREVMDKVLYLRDSDAVLKGRVTVQGSLAV